MPRAARSDFSAVLPFLILFLCLSPRGFASGRETWLLSFPGITHNDKGAYFYNDEWVGFYAPRTRLMYTVSRDSLSVPPLPAPPDSVRMDGFVYRADGITLVRQDSTGKVKSFSTRKLKRPVFGQRFPASGNQKALLQTIVPPLAVGGGRIWFGLQLTDTVTGLHVAGLGSFDTRRSLFDAFYDSSLIGHNLRWIRAAGDTVDAVFAADSSGHNSLRLLRHPVGGKGFTEFVLQRPNLGSESLLNAVAWGDTLLMSTDTAVVIWKPGAPPESWSSWMYASRDPIPLYLVAFSGDSAAPRDSVRFATLPPGKPVPVRIWHGDWMEIISAMSFVGIVDDADWRAYQTRWSESTWSCGDSLCFAHIRVPRGTGYFSADFIHAPVTYAGKEASGIRVNFGAAWARRSDLIPVLLPR